MEINGLRVCSVGILRSDRRDYCFSRPMGNRSTARGVAGRDDFMVACEDDRAAVPVPESETELGLAPPSWLIISDAERALAVEGVK